MVGDFVEVGEEIGRLHTQPFWKTRSLGSISETRPQLGQSRSPSLLKLRRKTAAAFLVTWVKPVEFGIA